MARQFSSRRSVGTVESLEPRTLLSDVIAVGPEFRVNTHTPDRQKVPAIAMDSDGDFVIAWGSDGQDGSLFGVYAQRYNSAGQPQGNEFRVNSFTTGTQSSPSIAMDADGGFVVAWNSSNSQDGSGYGVYAQRYNGAGVPQGSEFRVNTYTTGDQKSPAVAIDADGDFVIAWQSIDQDGSFWGVYAQRFNADGVAQAGEFRVNTFTTSGQENASVGMSIDGDFVIGWTSGGEQDGSSAGVYAQRYNSVGVPQGGEFRVNSFTTDAQAHPAIAIHRDGDFVVAWQSSNQAGSSSASDIYAKRYDAAGIPQGEEFRLNTYSTNSQSLCAIAMDAASYNRTSWMTGI